MTAVSTGSGAGPSELPASAQSSPGTSTSLSNNELTAIDGWILTSLEQFCQNAGNERVEGGSWYQAMKAHLQAICPYEHWRPVLQNRVNRMRKSRHSPHAERWARIKRLGTAGHAQMKERLSTGKGPASSSSSTETTAQRTVPQFSYTGTARNVSPTESPRSPSRSTPATLLDPIRSLPPAHAATPSRFGSPPLPTPSPKTPELDDDPPIFISEMEVKSPVAKAPVKATRRNPVVQDYEMLIDFETDANVRPPPPPPPVSVVLVEPQNPEPSNESFDLLVDLDSEPVSSYVDDGVRQDSPCDDPLGVTDTNTVGRTSKDGENTVVSLQTTPSCYSPLPVARSPFPPIEKTSYLLRDQRCRKVTDIQKAVMFTPGLFTYEESAGTLIPQYGLLGKVHLDGWDSSDDSSFDTRLYLNINEPASFFICGRQGSGKSHTMSCILENHLLPHPDLGQLTSPRSALVFNYNEATTGIYARVCEAAYLGQASSNHPGAGVQNVTVLVPPSKFRSTLVETYSQMANVQVRELRLRQEHITAAAIKKLVSLDPESSCNGTVEKILRDMVSSTPSDTVDCDGFKTLLNRESVQAPALEQRLRLLTELVDDTEDSCFEFSSGSVTIVDLSCLEINQIMACILFDLITGVYLASASSAGKIIAIDDADKYMTSPTCSQLLTSTLLTLLRTHHHHNTTLLLAAQDPTPIDPRIIALCSAAIIHNVTSPAWVTSLCPHIALEEEASVLFERIVELGVGEAWVLAPSAMVEKGWGEVEEGVGKMGRELVRVGVREKVMEGGR
ncbi:hypothetical protein EX30DRAFT_369677 [Ascodesmis nigricans]|uniref:P-loop containing nucleoside triphosphate hydrolase protein n=1 Tax=Ascodesmis nigricans TaxID=341454 RepID=A0A4S2N587_9PEZI|nr:hypothetical protein EX30DRAFT_369677 [Ascodesmis nigricans]